METIYELILYVLWCAYTIYVLLYAPIIKSDTDTKTFWFAYCEGEKRQFITKKQVTRYQYEHYDLFENAPVRDITSNTIWFVVRDSWL